MLSDQHGCAIQRLFGYKRLNGKVEGKESMNEKCHHFAFSKRREVVLVQTVFQSEETFGLA